MEEVEKESQKPEPQYQAEQPIETEETQTETPDANQTDTRQEGDQKHQVEALFLTYEQIAPLGPMPDNIGQASGAKQMENNIHTESDKTTTELGETGNQTEEEQESKTKLIVSMGPMPVNIGQASGATPEQNKPTREGNKKRKLEEEIKRNTQKIDRFLIPSQKNSNVEEEEETQ